MIIHNTKLKITVYFLAVLFFFSLADKSHAATINAASCSQADVQAAINAASNGDIVAVPAGSCTWSSALTVGKAVTISGSGTTLTASGSMADGFFHITGFTASSLVRVTGFTFQMTNWTPIRGIRVDGMTGGVTQGEIRIDHNTFHFGISQIYFYHGKGLIDNNYFYNGVLATEIDAGSVDNAWESWESMAAGTADAIFWEDNHFIANANYTYDHTAEQIGTENGSKLVIRYNNFDGTATGAPGGLYEPIMTHGSAAGGCSNGYWQQGKPTGCRRGQSVVEIYNNTIAGNRFNQPIVLRGSANLVYNNTLTKTSPITPSILLREEEYDGGQWVPARTTWPGEDQIHNTFFWNNTLNGVQLNSDIATNFTLAPDASAGIQKDRDVYFHAPCASGDTTASDGYPCTHGKATFTGLNGGSASYPTDGSTRPTLGNMSVTYTGDNAYYGYTPYTYPHPLTLAGAVPPPDTTPPAAPSGVTVI